MRINLPSAILLSGTVMLLSAAGTFAQSNDTATPAAPAALAKNSSAAEPAATQSRALPNRLRLKSKLTLLLSQAQQLLQPQKRPNMAPHSPSAKITRKISLSTRRRRLKKLAGLFTIRQWISSKPAMPTVQWRPNKAPRKPPRITGFLTLVLST